jgi:hypothetical protein
MTHEQALQRLRAIERAIKQSEQTQDAKQVRAFLVPLVMQQAKQTRKQLTQGVRP